MTFAIVVAATLMLSLGSAGVSLCLLGARRAW
jgi:hypothetical protein